MKILTQDLLRDLSERTRRNLEQAQLFKEHSSEELNYRPAAESWSVLECLEHLNLYGDYYLPEIEKRLTNNPTKPEQYFKPGWVGDYFAKMMLPREKLNKMNTFKDKNPFGSDLDKKTLDRFIAQQEKLLELLERSANVSLNKTKTSISISKYLKLKLGDTFRVVIYHNDRHIAQAMKVLESYQDNASRPTSKT